MRAIGTGFVAVAAIGLLLSGCGGGSDDTTTATTLQQPTAFNVNLTGTEVVPGPGDLSGTATAQLTVDPKGTQVCYTITLSGLQGIDAGHINEGKAGVAGPVVVTIPPSTADAWEGCVDAKPSVIKNLSAGTRSYYVNLQSNAYPDGAVRAQLTGWRRTPMTDDRLYFRQLLAGRDFATDDPIAQQMVNFVYLVGDRETGEALIVDPAYGVRELVEIAGRDDMRIVGALVTHYHPDHVGGSLMGWEIEGVAALLGLDGVDAPIHVNRAEARGVQRVAGASESDLVLHDGGDVVTVGAIPITLLHTPGHTPGSQCFLVDGRLVAGDTLFLDGCGRTDLPGGDSDEMYRSLTQRLAAVPDDTVLYPGHQYSPDAAASMGVTRQRNYVFRLPTIEQWRVMFS